ncbi:hypothetical protein [Lacticaseibacillus daqingensis]|uniref:hypothetical protein n=1 Tax=Lacticaseibacillus daqingensis TaxID=2486014 RepID=UPI000F79C1C7|nr:hypothetical protein [Lacticaseibacillus daqingensis]
MKEILVTHKKFGVGVILAMTADMVTVKFQSAGTKQFALPQTFENQFLVLNDGRNALALYDELFGQSVQETATPLPVKVDAPLATEPEIASLVIGRIYTNREIQTTFKVSTQGGMRKSNQTQSLVLISKMSNDPERNPYEDRWRADGLFHYTGMGKVGDQSLTYMQNKTLNESDRNGVSVYLFETNQPNQYLYRGEVQLAGPAYAAREADAEGKLRRVYKFPLRVKSN